MRGYGTHCVVGSRCDRPSNEHFRSNQCYAHVKTILLKETVDFELAESWPCRVPFSVPWHQIVHLTVHDTTRLSDLRFIVNRATLLWTLQLTTFPYDLDTFDEGNQYVLLNLLEDRAMCEVLRRNGL